MSRTELYQWFGQVRQVFGEWGHWQVMTLALFSYGVMLARHCAPSRVAEKLPLIGKADTVQRRLERFLANRRLDWQHGCQVWSRWVLGAYRGKDVILLVDETKLGAHLSVMVVGLAYRGGCLPLAFWSYPPKAWPLGQVALIDELLSWIAPSIPAGRIPLLQADRGIGTSPALLQAVEARGWHYLFRVQKNTRLRQENGDECPLAQLVTSAGQTWCGQGHVFKKAGWLASRVQIVWGSVYREPWCLVTNCPTIDGWRYGVRYWQEASFRDLKSDGWQWQCSRVWKPDHANRLLLVLVLAYAWVISLGTLAFDSPAWRPRLSKGYKPRFSLFRLGLRLWEAVLGRVSGVLIRGPSQPHYFHFVDPPSPSLKTVGH